MIAKGTTHNNGAKLAQYMTTGKGTERAELWQLRGFEATNIKDAFRDVQIMADGTKCQQPFFHVQVRNPEGEILTRQQWEITANRIERMLGLSGQPRAIAFHTHEQTGHEHMHIAWSRIDENTLTAKQLPFFKDRLKKVSRELELHFGLTVVSSKREGPIKYAPTRAQEEQARRLGVDIHEVRNTIRECWDRSDCGRSFEAALAEKGLRLAQGEKRDFLVIDSEGGMHALGKRILGVSAAQTRQRMSDLNRDQLPTVQQARDSIRDLSRDWQHERPAPVWDRDRDNSAWQDAVIKAAIKKEKTERRFVEPKRQREKRAGGREKISPFMPPQATPYRSTLGLSPSPPSKTTPRHHFEDAARDATKPERAPLMSENLKGTHAHIWTAYNQSRDARAFAAALDEHGIALAAATKEEADRSNKVSVFAKEVGNFAPRYREGEIVAVTEQGRVYQLNRRTTGEDRPDIERFLKRLDRNPLQGIEATKQTLQARVEQHDIGVQAFRDLLRDTKNTERLQKAQKPGRHGRSGNGKRHEAPAVIRKAPLRAGRAALDAATKAVEGVFSLLAPMLTPEQIRQGEKAAQKREAEAEHTINFSRYTSGFAQQRQNREQEQEAERRHHRERDGGGRER